MRADPSPHTLHKVSTSHPQEIWGEGVGEEGLTGAKSYPMGLSLFFGLSPQATNRQEKQDHLHLHPNPPHSVPKGFSRTEMQSNHQDTQMDKEGLSPGCEASANRSQGKAAGSWCRASRLGSVLALSFHESQLC